MGPRKSWASLFQVWGFPSSGRGSHGEMVRVFSGFSRRMADFMGFNNGDLLGLNGIVMGFTYGIL